MKNSICQFRLGARSSKLAVLQTQSAVNEMQRLFTTVRFKIIPMSSPGDEDHKIDLRESDSNFFTQYLDQAIETEELDCAIHSAKDMPVPIKDTIDWFWLPWREDPRDVIVLSPEKSIEDLTGKITIGISSDRREDYCKKRFKSAILKTVRGNIEDRIAQLDNGDFDMLIMAGAALKRLSLENRITEWIPISDLETPPGQGFLAFTYRRGDIRFNRIRSLFIKPAVLIGGGPGHSDYCTIAGMKELAECDVCIYDALSPQELLQTLKKDAVAIDAGKRRGKYKISRVQLDQMIVDLVRQGKKIVRLKGGDPGIFGRLAEEISILDAHNLPFRVIPGVSSLTASTTGTGLLLTRRGISRGFTVMTPCLSNGRNDSISAKIRQELPLVFFMGLNKISGIVTELTTEGRPETDPISIVLGASLLNQKIISGNLANIESKVKEYKSDLPGLVLVGNIAHHSNCYPWKNSALQNKRVLLTCSEELQEIAESEVLRYGGTPIKFPLIKISPSQNAKTILEGIDKFDWIVLTSPSSVNCLFAILKDLDIDFRNIPKIIVSGAGVSRILRKYGIIVDAQPENDFSSEALIQLARNVIKPNEKVLRLRSKLAGEKVERSLTRLGALVTDCILYVNEPVSYEIFPEFDYVFFASSSAVKAFLNLWGAENFRNKLIVAIGNPTSKTLYNHGIESHIVSPNTTISDSIKVLAGYAVNKDLNSIGKN